MSQPIVLHSLTWGYVSWAFFLIIGLGLSIKTLGLFREALIDPKPKGRRDAFILGSFVLAGAIAWWWVMFAASRNEGVYVITFHDSSVELRYLFTTVHVRDAECRSVKTWVLDSKKRTRQIVLLNTEQGEHQMMCRYYFEEERRQLEQIFSELNARIQKQSNPSPQ